MGFVPVGSRRAAEQQHTKIDELRPEGPGAEDGGA